MADAERISKAAQSGFVTASPVGYVPPADITALEGGVSPEPYAVGPSAKPHKAVVVRCTPTGVCGRMGAVITQTLKKLKWDVTQLDPVFGATKTVQQVYTGLLDRAIAEKPDVIVTLAIASTVVGPSLERAKSAGIKTVQVFAGSETGKGYDAYVPYAYNVQREVYSAYAVAQGGGSTELLAGELTGYANVWTPAMKQFLGNCDECKIDDFAFSAEQFLDPVKINQITTSAIRKHPNATYMLLPSQGGQIPAMEQAIRATGSKIKVLNTEATLEAPGRIRSGTTEAIAYVPTDWPAFAGVDAAVRAAEGQEIPDERDYRFGVGLWTKDNVPPANSSYVQLFDESIKVFDFATPYAKAWNLPVSALRVDAE